MHVKIEARRCVWLAMQDRGKNPNAMPVFLPTHSASLTDAKVYRIGFICMSAAVVFLCLGLYLSVFVCMFVCMHA